MKISYQELRKENNKYKDELQSIKSALTTSERFEFINSCMISALDLL